MPMREPRRPEAKVWLGQFNRHFSEWVAAGRTHDEHMRLAHIALRSMLEREPEGADTVSSLLSTILHQHADRIGPDVLFDLAKLGLESEQMRSDDHPTRWAERSFLQLAFARAAEAQGRRFDAIHTLTNVAFPALDDRSPLDSVRRYLAMKAEAALAELREADLDRQAAGTHAQAALDACEAIAASNEGISRLLVGLTTIFYGGGSLPNEVVKALLRSVWFELSETEVLNAARLARCEVFAAEAGAGSPSAQALIDALLARFKARGVAGVTAADLIPLFRNAPGTLCRRLIDETGAAAEAVGVDRGEFDTVLAAAAAAYGACSQSDRREYLERAADIEGLQEPVIRTVGLGLLVAGELREGAARAKHAEAFTQALREHVATDIAPTLDWRTRAELDVPVSLLIKDAAVRVAEKNTSETRVRLAGLLDALRATPARTLAWLSLLSGAEARSAFDAARALADDLLSRVHYALGKQPATLAMIVQHCEDETLFICVTGEGMEFEVAGPEFVARTAELRACVAEQTATVQRKRVPPDDATVQLAAGAAFDAIPARVRELMIESDTILYCPDSRAGGDEVPLEILYDGEAWLGIGRVVSRLPSLDSMAHAAEGFHHRATQRRALAIGISEAPGFPKLPGAAAEIDAIRATLEADGWDAPQIRESRVDAPFILNRAPFAAHLHIASHGEADGASQAIVLPRGERLTPDEILNGAYGCTPTLWLNTCVLGQSTYLGAGVSWGVAQAFISAGSPAVIANILPVNDAVAQRLAERFYEHARTEDFGESLRKARSDVAALGVSPVLWGPTVLMGDPRVTLTPVFVEFAAWQSGLARAVLVRNNARELEPVLVDLDAIAQSAPDDVLPRSAAEAARALLAHAGEIDPGMLAEACRLCLRVGASEGAVIAAFGLAEMVQNEHRGIALPVTLGAISLLRPLEGLSSGIPDLINRLLVRAEQLRRGDRAFRVNVTEPEGAKSDPKGLEFGKFLMETKLAIDARARWYGLSPAPRENEAYAEDVLWNAVMASRTKTFEDMPETHAFAMHVATKLAGRDALDRSRVAEAARMLAGLLRWMWDSHNIVAVEMEMIVGHTRVAQMAIESFKANWSENEPWMTLVSGYGVQVREWLNGLEGLPYDDSLYPAIDKTMQRILDDGLSRLQQVHSQYPERTPDAILLLMGVLIEVNTYSYVQGSVPEGICERLKRVHHEFSMKAEGCLMPWLMEGFREVREGNADELQRWCYGIGSPQ